MIFSSSGLYGALHLPTALFMQAAGIQMKHLPTAGGGPALTAILGNNSQVLVSSIAAANAQMRAGKLKALASFGGQRAPALPDVPTMKELGYNIEFYLWVGLFAPKGTPAPIINTLRDVSKKAAADEKFAAAMENLGQDVAYLDQAEFKTFWDSDAKRVEDAVRRSAGSEVRTCPRAPARETARRPRHSAPLPARSAVGRGRGWGVLNRPESTRYGVERNVRHRSRMEITRTAVSGASRRRPPPRPLPTALRAGGGEQMRASPVTSPRRSRRRRRVHRARRLRFRHQRRPAVRHHVRARRRHDAETHGRADDGLRAIVIATRGKDSAPIPAIDWSDRGHAALLVLITAIAVACYQPLGFLITMSALVFALLVVVERRNPLRAAATASRSPCSPTGCSARR